MPIHERREHFRIHDHLYFDYRITVPGEICSDLSIKNQLLGESGQRYMEATQYFQNIDVELAELTSAMGLKDPALAHYLNLLNAKIDYLSVDTEGSELDILKTINFNEVDSINSQVCHRLTAVIV